MDFNAYYQQKYGVDPNTIAYQPPPDTTPGGVLESIFPSQGGNIIQNLVGGIVKPLGNATLQNWENMKNLLGILSGVAAESTATGKANRQGIQPGLLELIDQEAKKQLARPSSFISKGAAQELRTNPLDAILRTQGSAGLTAASLLVPGAGAGAGLPSIIGRGALSGGLFGAGQGLGEKGSNLADIAGQAGSGALFGGALAGTLGAIGKGIKAIRGTPAEQPKSLIDTLSKQGEYNYGEVPQIGEKAQPTKLSNKFLTTEIIDNSGIKNAYLKTATEDNLGKVLFEGNKLVPDGNLTSYNGERKILESLYEPVKNEVKAIGADVPVAPSVTKSILSDIKSQLKGRDITGNAIFKELKTRVSEVVNYSDMVDVLTWLDDATQKIAGKTDASSTTIKRILDGGRGIISSKIKSIDPIVRQGFSLLSTMNYGMTGIDNLLKTSYKARFFQGPLGLPINLEPMIVAGRGIASKGLNAVGGGGLGNIAKTPAPNILPQLGIIPSLLPKGQQEQNLGTTSTKSVPNNMSATGTSSDLQRQQIILSLLTSGAKPSDVKIIAELLGLTGGGGKQLTTAAAEKITDTKTSLAYLDQLESVVGSNAGRFGLLQGGALGNVVQGLGLDPGRAYIQSQINTIAQVIGKALEGGKLTDQDIARYREMLPTLSDTPANAMQKIASLRALLKSRLSSQVTGYQNAGYSAQDMLDALNSAGTE